MTPLQKIKTTILKLAIINNHIDLDFSTINESNIDELYDLYHSEIEEIEYDFREGSEATNIEPLYSRHYESRSVASEMSDGSWVGWTYWYGGGKHANPEDINWINEAYNVEYVEKQVTIKVFNKIED